MPTTGDELAALVSMVFNDTLDIKITERDIKITERAMK